MGNFILATLGFLLLVEFGYFDQSCVKTDLKTDKKSLKSYLRQQYILCLMAIYSDIDS